MDLKFQHSIFYPKTYSAAHAIFKGSENNSNLERS